MKTTPDSSGEESVEAVVFPDADGIPNSHLPLLIHHQAFSGGDPDKLAGLMEQRFAANGWTGAWRDGVYTFRHYHSNTHEVLGVFQGRAVLELGGDGGGKFEVSPGDVIVIPAGVSHQLLKSSEDFQVVGAYPNGRDPDLLRGEPGERPAADRKIADVPLPLADPFQGPQGALRKYWLQ
jgi:uncharacterized protein YjlB